MKSSFYHVREKKNASNASANFSKNTVLSLPAVAVLQQKKENKTGLPDQLKTGVENLSGIDISDVRVHYNSSQPAQLNALAYAQGTDIYVGSGQEKHLAHEAWHVVQQKQGRVRPTMQMKEGVAVNDDPELEKEADVMGGKAVQMKDGYEVYANKQNESLKDRSVLNQLTTQLKVELWRGDAINSNGDYSYVKLYHTDDAQKHFADQKTKILFSEIDGKD